MKINCKVVASELWIVKNKPNENESEKISGKIAETLRGLFVTNKNAMKYDVCIKPKKQNVLTDGKNNFKTSTLKEVMT